MNIKVPLILVLTGFVLYVGVGKVACAAPSSFEMSHQDRDYEAIKKGLEERYGRTTPTQWGVAVAGVKTRLKTTEKAIALTLDACGSAKGMALDRVLMEFLEREQVPATLFINARWVGPNRAAFDHLAANPLFEIANHGLKHKPASVTGRSAYGINGTRNVGELVDEMELSNRQLAELTGKRSRFFRSGTAFYDDVAIKVAGELGVEIAGFSVIGDAGATFSREQVRNALLKVVPGDIVLIHMNHPGSGTAAGVMDAIPELKKRGFRFVKLSDMELQ